MQLDRHRSGTVGEIYVLLAADIPVCLLQPTNTGQRFVAVIRKYVGRIFEVPWLNKYVQITVFSKCRVTVPVSQALVL